MICSRRLATSGAGVKTRGISTIIILPVFSPPNDSEHCDLAQDTRFHARSTAQSFPELMVPPVLLTRRMTTVCKKFGWPKVLSSLPVRRQVPLSEIKQPRVPPKDFVIGDVKAGAERRRSRPCRGPLPTAAIVLFPERGLRRRVSPKKVVRSVCFWKHPP